MFVIYKCNSVHVNIVCCWLLYSLLLSRSTWTTYTHTCHTSHLLVHIHVPVCIHVGSVVSWYSVFYFGRFTFDVIDIVLKCSFIFLLLLIWVVVLFNIYIYMLFIHSFFLFFLFIFFKFGSISLVNYSFLFYSYFFILFLVFI